MAKLKTYKGSVCKPARMIHCYVSQTKYSKMKSFPVSKIRKFLPILFWMHPNDVPEFIFLHTVREHHLVILTVHLLIEVLIIIFTVILTVSGGSFPRMSIKALYISGGRPSKNFPHPATKSVSPGSELQHLSENVLGW